MRITCEPAPTYVALGLLLPGTVCMPVDSSIGEVVHIVLGVDPDDNQNVLCGCIASDPSIAAYRVCSRPADSAVRLAAIKELAIRVEYYACSAAHLMKQP